MLVTVLVGSESLLDPKRPLNKVGKNVLEMSVQVHVYATDANNPRMENSDSVGWFTVDVRDLAGQRLRDERWVKLQGANPAEILISSTLAMVREGEEGKSRDEPSVQSLSQASSPCSVSSSRAEAECMMPSEVQPTETAQPYASLMTLPGTGTVSELDALPVGPGADGLDARTFSLGIMIKGAARLLQLAPQLDGTGFGFWFSYSVFGVVVQTDRFERLAPPAGNGPVVEPMMDSFRMRATLPGLCDFLNEAPPLQVCYIITYIRTAHVSSFGPLTLGEPPHQSLYLRSLLCSVHLFLVLK